MDIIKDYDLVIDGSDNFDTRYLVNDACYLAGKTNVHGSIFQFEGMATRVRPEPGPVLPLPLSDAAAAGARPQLKRGRRPGRAPRHHRSDAGHRGHQAAARHRRAADRPAPDLRRARHALPRGASCGAIRSARSAATHPTIKDLSIHHEARARACAGSRPNGQAGGASRRIRRGPATLVATAPSCSGIDDAGDRISRAAERRPDSPGRRSISSPRRCRADPPDDVLGGADALLAWRPPARLAQRAPRLRWIQSLTGGVRAAGSARTLPADRRAHAARAARIACRCPSTSWPGCSCAPSSSPAIVRDQSERTLAPPGEPAARRHHARHPRTRRDRRRGRAQGRARSTCASSARKRDAGAAAARRTRVRGPDGTDDVLARIRLRAAAAAVDAGDARADRRQAALARMKPGAWLLNFGRGDLVVDADLVAAVQRRTIAGAVLDVYRTEPLPAEHAVLDDATASSCCRTSAVCIPSAIRWSPSCSSTTYVAGSPVSRCARSSTARRGTDLARSVGGSLSDALVERFSQRDLRRRLGIGLPFVTVDADGRPHPMLLSYLEVKAYDTRTVGVVILARSGSARNLVERGTATLMAVEPDTIVYVKLRTVDGPLPVEGGEDLGLGYFLLEVDEVLEDAAADWEAGMRITEPIRYAPTPTLDEPWARATLAALAAPRARA